MSRPANGDPGRLRFVWRKVFAAALLVLTPIGALAVAVLDAISRGQTLQQIVTDRWLGNIADFSRSQPVWLLIGVMVALALFLTSDVEIPIARWFGKKSISLAYQPMEPWISKLPWANVPLGDKLYRAPATFFRIELRSQGGTAHGCSVYLRNVEILGGAAFESTGYDGTQQIRFSYHEDAESGFAPHDVNTAVVPQYVDLLSVDPVHNRIFVKWRTDYIINEHLFTREGVYRLTLSARSTDAGDAVPLTLLLLWPGNWQFTEILRDETTSTAQITARLEELKQSAASVRLEVVLEEAK